MKIPDPKQLAGMSWDDLYSMRLERALQDPRSQALIAPYEHRAYAREQVANNPLLAPVYGVAVPGYQVFKSMIGTSRSAPSLDQIQQGLIGTGEGMAQGIENLGAKAKRGLLSMFD